MQAMKTHLDIMLNLSKLQVYADLFLSEGQLNLGLHNTMQRSHDNTKFNRLWERYSCNVAPSESFSFHKNQIVFDISSSFSSSSSLSVGHVHQYWCHCTRGGGKKKTNNGCDLVYGSPWQRGLPINHFPSAPLHVHLCVWESESTVAILRTTINSPQKQQDIRHTQYHNIWNWNAPVLWSNPPNSVHQWQHILLVSGLGLRCSG